MFGLASMSGFKFGFPAVWLKFDSLRFSFDAYSVTNMSRLGIGIDSLPSQSLQTNENHPGGPGCSK